eukprot:360885-Chlamydomonas_euryale.AAC.7
MGSLAGCRHLQQVVSGTSARITNDITHQTWADTMEIHTLQPSWHLWRALHLPLPYSLTADRFVIQRSPVEA